nr:MAG: hypothetical protein DIU61_14970 [Bacteroidota bacterium]
MVWLTGCLKIGLRNQPKSGLYGVKIAKKLPIYLALILTCQCAILAKKKNPKVQSEPSNSGAPADGRKRNLTIVYIADVRRK